MKLHELIERYGMSGKRKTCAHPEIKSYYIGFPSIMNVVKMFLAKKKNFIVTMDEVLRHYNYNEIKTLYIPVTIHNPHNPTKFNDDILYFDVDGEYKTELLMNCPQPPMIVFVRNVKTGEFEDNHMFSTFKECAEECEKLNDPRYKENTMPHLIKAVDLFYDAFRLYRKHQFEGVNYGHNQTG